MMLRKLCLGALVCAAMTGCVKGDAQAQGVLGPPYQRPPGWLSECFGRLVVDVPGRLQFGEATRAFYEQSGRRVERYSLGGLAGSAFAGDVKLASVLLTESGPLASSTELDVVLRQADFQYEKGWRANRTIDESEVSETKRRTEKVERPGSRSYLWRHKNQFDFGALLESDMRVRMLHGELSGEGSLAQAKAVVDALWPRYRPRKPGEMPSGPGICTPYGFLADPPKLTERDYGLSFSFPDARHSNAILHLEVSTHRPDKLPPGLAFKATPIEQWPTPWEEDEQRAARNKERCRPQQGTASRDLFGCTFAGARSIKKHRDIEYLTLADGQRARLLVMELYPGMNDSYEYEIRLEAQGLSGSATRPDITLVMYGLGKGTEIASMRGKSPPSIEEAVKTVRTIAASLRLRPGAVEQGATVKDTLEGVR